MNNKKSSKAGYYIFTVLLFLAIVFPFVCDIFASFKTSKDISKGIRLIPSEFTNKSFNTLFDDKNFGKYLWNSFAISVITTLIVLIIAFFAAYAIARLEFKGKKLLEILMFGALLIPQISIISPIYMFMKDAGLRNSYIALIIPYFSFALPLAVLVLSLFLKRIPFELEEAAALEGATFFQTLKEIVLPLAAPGMLITAALVFISSWSEYMFALAINTKNTRKTAIAFLNTLLGGKAVAWGEIAAGVIIVAIPCIIFALILNKRLSSDIAAEKVD